MNTDFKFNKQLIPRRVLTNPSDRKKIIYKNIFKFKKYKAAFNDGQDN